MLAKFKQCFTYESFLATGSNNSVNNVNEPELFSVTRVYSDSAFWTSFRILMKNWNRHMIEDDCYPTCKDLLIEPDTVDQHISTLAHIDSESQRINTIAPFLKNPDQAERFVKHNLKPLLSIRGYDGNQFLLADECAVLAFFAFEKYAQRSVISFKDGYTVAEATDDPAVNTFCYKDIPRDAMVRALIEALGRDR